MQSTWWIWKVTVELLKRSRACENFAPVLPFKRVIEDDTVRLHIDKLNR